MFQHIVLTGLMLPWLVMPVSLANAESDPGNPKVGPAPFVSNVYVFNKKSDPPGRVGLGESIRVKVDDLDVLQQKQRTDCKAGAPCMEKKIHLFLNLRELKGINPVLDPELKELQFRLLPRDQIPEYLHNKEQKAIWAELFGFRDDMKTELPVNVSLGLEDGSPLASSHWLTLVRIKTDDGLVFYCVMMVVVLILYGTGFRKGLFGDRGPTGNGAPALSLARVQMGFWFFLVVAAFLFIWLVIGELPTIPASVLALIGIASGTTLGAAMIDSSKRAVAGAVVESESKKQTAAENLDISITAKIKERGAVEAALKNLNTQDPGSIALVEIKKQQSADLSRAIEQLEAERRSLETQLPCLKKKSNTAKSQQTAVSAHTFLDDLFSDENGWSFHRVQMGIWTLVLGFVFVGKVLDNLEMPDFDSTLLALMGISSGTYLGFKFPEQQPPKAS